MKIPTSGKSIDIKSIWVNVICKECGAQYNVQMHKPAFMKHCRCGKGVFVFHLENKNESVIIHATFTGADLQTEDYAPNGWELDDE